MEEGVGGVREVGGVRAWSVVVLCSSAIVVCYADRANIATALLPMGAQFGWSRRTEGLVLSSFYYGYGLSQVPAAYLARRLGGVRLLLAAVLLWSFFTLATPLAAALGTGPLLACRLLMGLGEGVSFPACHHLVAQLLPARMHSRAVAAFTASSYLGTVAANYLTPLLLARAGWPSAFYLFGMLGFLWCALAAYAAIALRCFTPPARVTHVREVEMQEMRVVEMQDMRGEGDGVEGDVEVGVEEEGREVAPSPSPSSPSPASSSIPWLRLAGCRQVWAVCVNQFCQGWGFYVLLSWIPSYYAEVHHVQVGGMGLLVALPYLVQGVASLCAGAAADRLLARGWGPVGVRRLFQVPGMLLPALALLLLAYLDVSAPVAMLLLAAALGSNALTVAGVSVYQLDFAPHYAALVFGMGNAMATLAGLVGVFATGYMLQLGSWFLVFWSAVALFAAGAATWLLLARGHTGPLPYLTPPFD